MIKQLLSEILNRHDLQLILRSLFFLMFVLAPGFCIGQYYNQEVAATIQLSIQENSFAKISGQAFNKSEISKSLSYRLAVIKKGISGQSNNEQKGRIVLEPGQKKGLSKSTVNLNEKDTTVILLLIYEDEKLVGKDRKVIHGLKDLGDINQAFSPKKDEKEDLKETKEDGIVLKGIVLQETKTKAGTDFYNFFYSKYLENNIDGKKIVIIREELSIANTTKIKVLVDKEVVAEFIVNPRSDYLKSMADSCIRRVYNYFLRLEKTKAQITKY